MDPSFFSPIEKIADFNTTIIEKLTSIRLSGYDASKINLDISEMDILAIKTLIIRLGTNILKANILGSRGIAEFTASRNKFIKMAENFITVSHKFDITSYAAELLQYYTIISDDGFSSELNYRDYSNFLATNEKTKFGNTTNNSFILEYKLIIIYNELACLTDAQTGKIAPVDDNEIKAIQLATPLFELQKTVSDYLLNAPDNVFPLYLNFIINYTAAKLFELNYRLLETEIVKLKPEDVLQLSDRQQQYIKSSKDALSEINNLYNHFSERNIPHAKGMEYSFGQDLLHKFPPADLEATTVHINTLLIK